MNEAQQIVLNFWQAMDSNDFHAASQWLSEDYECYWPQSSELIRGRKNFAELNSHYPADDNWQFIVNNSLADGNQVVTDVSVTDGTTVARAVTFSTVDDGLISRQLEYWPDDYPAPEWRRQWVEVISLLTGDCCE